MPTATDVRKAELEKWLVKMNPDLAKKFRTDFNNLAQDAKTNNKNADADALGEEMVVQAAKGVVTVGDIQKKADQQAKADAAEQAQWEKKSEFSADAIQNLVPMLQMWADEKFLASRNMPDRVVPTKNPFVDRLISETIGVLRDRNDIDKMGQTIEKWRKIQKAFKIVLQTAQQNFTPKKNQPKPKDSDIVLALIPEGLQALDAIEWYIGQGHAEYEQREGEKNMAVPEMGEKLALRQLKQLEPTMNALQAAASQIGDFAHGANTARIEKAAKVAKIYFSVHEMSEALEKFHEAGLAEQAKTLTDLTAFLVDQANEAYMGYLEGAKELAEKLGKEAAAKALGKRLSTFQKVSTVVAAYELGKNVGQLAVAIRDGDWQKIGEAGYGVVSGAVSVGQGVGAVTAAAATKAATTPIAERVAARAAQGTGVGAITIEMGAVAVWGAIESVRLAAAIRRWGIAMTAMDAVKALLKDANAIVPNGKAMAVASDLAAQSDPSSTEYEVHKADMEKLLPDVKQRINKLYEYHFQPSSNPQITGSHPELIVAFGSEAHEAGKGLSYPDDALSQSNRFLAIAKGIKAVVNKGDELWGDKV
jgi:hypothetical protein